MASDKSSKIAKTYQRFISMNITVTYHNKAAFSTHRAVFSCWGYPKLPKVGNPTQMPSYSSLEPSTAYYLAISGSPPYPGQQSKIGKPVM